MKPSPQTIPAGIWALGFVSLFMDISSELVHSLLPLFMVTTLGSSMMMVGIVEGIAEASALITRIFSGAWSDYLGKRKLFTLIGYGMAAFTKPLFPLADSIATAFSARLLDRIGKGIRGAPRDALIGDIAPEDSRGACFGLRKSLDTIGSLIGPLLAMLGMALFANDIRSVLWLAVIPAFLSVAILAAGVKEPASNACGNNKQPFSLKGFRHVGKAYWQLLLIAGMLGMARFSEAFLILKAQDIGLPLLWTPAVLVVMNITYTLSAYPVGTFSDRHMSRHRLVTIGIGILVIADLVLAFADGLLMLALGVGLWGLHMGFTHGLLAAMVTDSTPSHLRGTAYGIYNLVSGIALLLASILAGWLWDSFGSPATFLAGAGFSAFTLLFLLVQKNNASFKA